MRMKTQRVARFDGGQTDSGAADLSFIFGKFHVDVDVFFPLPPGSLGFESAMFMSRTSLTL